jgi:ABC-2 type transport system permease protein
MPVVFILVMSLSMQALFKPDSEVKIGLIVADHDMSAESNKFIGAVKKIPNFLTVKSKAGVTSEEISNDVIKEKFKFGLVVNGTFAAYIRDINGGPGIKPLTLYADPAVQMPIQIGLKNRLELELSRLRLNTFFDRNAGMLAYAGFKRENIVPSAEGVINTVYVYKNKKETIIPSAAQQSVPAWLVFSMYFIVIPISLIFHTEKNNGTLQRIRSINVKSRYLIAGKLVSYYLISMIQVACMLLVGRYLVPLLGGDTIHFGDSIFGLFLIASCVGFNAISYGLLVSSLSKNSQAAASAGVVLVIILAAVGGIMVPKFVMPEIMQRIANVSPLSWGLEGFLDIMLRNGTVIDVVPRCALLAGTGLIMLYINGLMLRKKIIH